VNSFQLTFPIPESLLKIEHGKQILFLGSCFSDEIALKASYEGFMVDSNPFGTIFHPIAISRFVKETISGSDLSERIVDRYGTFLSWDASGTLYDQSESGIVNKMKLLREEMLENVKNAVFSVVTFGSAWGYRLNNSDELVANSHKFPGSNFTKELTPIDEIVFQWENIIGQLKDLNPKLNICFTVSPVRHSKDGLIENNHSKAILIESVRRLISENLGSYFPSFEIVIDELRDYRFFKTDRVHPNDEAIHYVWQRFSETFFTHQTKELSLEVIKLRRAESHKSLFNDSFEDKEHRKKTQELRASLLNKFPFLKLDL